MSICNAFSSLPAFLLSIKFYWVWFDLHRIEPGRVTYIRSQWCVVIFNVLRLILKYWLKVSEWMQLVQVYCSGFGTQFSAHTQNKMRGWWEKGYSQSVAALASNAIGRWCRRVLCWLFVYEISGSISWAIESSSVFISGRIFEYT